MKKAFVSFTTENGMVIAEAWTPTHNRPLNLMPNKALVPADWKR